MPRLVVPQRYLTSVATLEMLRKEVFAPFRDERGSILLGGTSG